MKMIRNMSLLFIGALAGCTADKAPAEVLEAPEPGLSARPRWLTFTCVEPGCETSRVTNIRVVGPRSIAVKRVVLSDRDRDDFEIELDKEAPFIMEPGDKIEIKTTYRPTGDPRLGDVDVMIAYTDASSNEDEDRVQPGELAVPLVRRLIGEPVLSVAPKQLDFGSVQPTAKKTLPLTISNSGFGNVGVVVDSVESDVSEMTVNNLPTFAVLPDTTWNVDVTFSPIEEKYTEGMITVKSADTSARPQLVAVFGTSLPRPTIAAIPSTGVDFGEVPVGTMAMATVEITNQGSDVLEIFRTEIVGGGNGNLSMRLPRNTTTATIASLRSIVATVELNATAPGVIDAILRMRTNDRANRDFDIPIRGLVTQPQAKLTPRRINFGTVPRGWTITRRVEVENTGYGELTIDDVSMVLGSSDLFTLQNIPTLPASLRHMERVSFEVNFRAEAQANFNGTIGIQSNDPDESGFLEVNVEALGASCEEGCPITNGTPSCAGGVCAIGMCDPGYYDTDMSAATGCECREIGRDPGSFCADGHYAGSLSDTDSDRANFTGVLAEDGDIDIITFFGKDDTSFFSDDYDVRVNLQSADPTIQMCVYRHRTANHENACFFENEQCGRSFRKDGSLGRDDSADYVVKIFRSASAAPTCTSYTVFMRND